MKTLSLVREMLVQGQPHYQGPWGWHYDLMEGGWGIFMFIFMLIFLGLVIAGIVLLVGYLSPHSRSKPSEDALEILKHH